MKILHKQMVLCRREDWQSALIRNIELRGDTLALNVREHSAGIVCLRAIDSGEQSFRWGRVSVGCTLPEDSLIRIYARASDSVKYSAEAETDEVIKGLGGSYGELKAGIEEVFGEPVASDEDFYINRTGRYLWLAFELIATGSEDPVISSVELKLTGDHMVDYLPAIYQSDDFTKRFMSVFDSVLMDMEQSIYDLPRRLDYENTDMEMLRQFASWVCIDPAGASREELTDWISTALPDYESMYTVEGVRRSVNRLTGRDPIIIENASVDHNSPDCSDPELYRRLYGDDPYKFFVLLDEDTFDSRNRMERFLEQMEGLIPAGTELELVLLKKCVQLDWHTYLGINSMVGSYIPVTIDENTTIHYDTMIGGQ